MASPFAETCLRTSNPSLLSSAHSDIDYCVVLTDGAGGAFQSVRALQRGTLVILLNVHEIQQVMHGPASWNM